MVASLCIGPAWQIMVGHSYGKGGIRGAGRIDRPDYVRFVPFNIRRYRTIMKARLFSFLHARIRVRHGRVRGTEGP
jgi:hypothetical protein